MSESHVKKPRSGEVVSWRAEEEGLSHSGSAPPLAHLYPSPPPPPLPPCVPATAASFSSTHPRLSHGRASSALSLWTLDPALYSRDLPYAQLLAGRRLLEAFLNYCLTFTFTQELQINWEWRASPVGKGGEEGLPLLKFLGR